MREFIISLGTVLVLCLSNNVFAESGSAQCSQYGAESECQSSGYCSWDPGKQMCQGGFAMASNDPCGQITCPCKCKPINGCEWSKVRNRCERL